MVQRDGFNGDAGGRRRMVEFHMAKSTVWGSLRIATDEGDSFWHRPDGFLFNSGVIKFVVGQISAQASSNFGIGLERNYAAGGTDKARGHERKETNVGAQIVECHAGAEIFLDGVLNGGLVDTETHILAGTRIEANRETCGWPIFDLHPDKGATGHKPAAGPAEKVANNGNLAKPGERRRDAEKEIRKAAAQFGHFISPPKSYRGSGRP